MRWGDERRACGLVRLFDRVVDAYRLEGPTAHFQDPSPAAPGAGAGRPPDTQPLRVNGVAAGCTGDR